MELGPLHVVAACLALTVGLAVLVRRKGGSWHVALGRVYLAAMLAVNLAALLLYDATGGPGPFHVLAVVSLGTTALGWLALRARGRRRGRGRIEAHAVLMTWSWIGVATAGIAQAANSRWPEQSPWPVAIAVLLASALGLLVVPRYVAREHRRRRTT